MSTNKVSPPSKLYISSTRDDIYEISGDSGTLSEYNEGGKLVVYAQADSGWRVCALLNIIAKHDDHLDAQAILVDPSVRILNNSPVDRNSSRLPKFDLVPKYEDAVGHYSGHGTVRVRPGINLAIDTELDILKERRIDQKKVDYTRTGRTLRVKEVGEKGVLVVVERTYKGSWPKTYDLVQVHSNQPKRDELLPRQISIIIGTLLIVIGITLMLFLALMFKIPTQYATALSIVSIAMVPTGVGILVGDQTRASGLVTIPFTGDKIKFNMRSAVATLIVTLVIATALLLSPWSDNGEVTPTSPTDAPLPPMETTNPDPAVVTPPQSPSIGTPIVRTINKAERIAVTDNALYLVADGNLHCYTINDMDGAPTPIATGGWAGKLAVTRDYVYQVKSTDDLYVSKFKETDITEDCKNITENIDFNTEGNWKGELAAKGDYVYLMRDGDLLVAKITPDGNKLDFGTLVPISEENWVGSQIAADGDYIYLTNSLGLSRAEFKFDGNDIHVDELSLIDAGNWEGELAVDRDTIYLLRGNELKLWTTPSE